MKIKKCKKMALYKNYSLSDVLRYLPLRNVKSTSSGITAICPFHKEKNNSFGITNEGAVRCFACHYTNNLRGLVKDLLGQSIEDVLGIDKISNSQFLFKQSIIEQTKKDFSKKIDNKNFIIYGEFKSIYDDVSCIKYIKDRRLSNRFIKDFNISYAENVKINNTIFKNRLIIPIIEDKKIIGYEGRDVLGYQKPKVLYSKNTSVNTLLNIDNLKYNELLYVVEGSMDLNIIYQYISRNCTTVFGIAVTKRQAYLLSKFKKIIVIPDNDDGGERFISILDELLDKEFYISKLKESEDPGKSSILELQEAIINKIESKDYFLSKYNVLKKPKVISWN